MYLSPPAEKHCLVFNCFKTQGGKRDNNIIDLQDFQISSVYISVCVCVKEEKTCMKFVNTHRGCLEFCHIMGSCRGENSECICGYISNVILPDPKFIWWVSIPDRIFYKAPVKAMSFHILHSGKSLYTKWDPEFEC